METRFFKKIAIIVFCLSLGLILSGLAHAQMAPNCSAVFALSGGGNPSANHLRYYKNIERVHNVYEGCPIFNYMATGNENDKVTMAYERVGGKTDKILLGEDGLPVLVSQKTRGGLQGGANYNDLKKGVETWSKANSQTDNNGPVVVYVTDHGSQIEGKGAVSLWNKTYLTPLQLNEIISTLPQEKRVIMLFDQCYGGEMLRSIKDKDGKVRRNTCGIAAASPGQLAFNGGGTMRNIEKIMTRRNAEKNQTRQRSGQDTYASIHKIMSSDYEIISAPAISSDLFAADWFNQKYTLNFAGALAGGKFLDPKNQCLKILDFNQTGGPSPVSSGLIDRVKNHWNVLNRELGMGGGYHGNLEQLINLHGQKEKMSEASFEELNNYELNTYNPQISKFLKKSFKPFDQYLAFKEKVNGNTPLSPEEKAQFQKIQEELMFFKAALTDEANLKSKGVAADYKIRPDHKTVEVIMEQKRLKNKKIDEWNDLFRVKKTLTKLTTLNALDRMVKEKDMESLETYLNIVDCEKTPLAR